MDWQPLEGLARKVSIQVYIPGDKVAVHIFWPHNQMNLITDEVRADVFLRLSARPTRACHASDLFFVAGIRKLRSDLWFVRPLRLRPAPRLRRSGVLK